MLIDGHEYGSELTVFKKAISISIDSVEEQWAILLRHWQVQPLQGLKEFGGIQIAFTLLFYKAKGID